MGLLAPVAPRFSPDLVDADELTDVSGVEHARTTVQLARGSVSTVEWLEHVLHPWSSFLIVPLFALANAGIEVSRSSLSHAWRSPITWGIGIGLVVGKPVGVLLATRASTASGIADPPEGTSFRQLLGAGNAAGIGFTVALFIAELAFGTGSAQHDIDVADAKMAILLASVVSGVMAYVVLRKRASVALDA
jgi:NhaA family Na+:H+ antiporter